MTIRTCGLALALLLASSNAFGQVVGDVGGGLGGGGLGGGTGGGVGGGDSGNPADAAFNQAQRNLQAPIITGLDASALPAAGFLSTSNVFGGYYAAPLFAGRAGATVTTTPGGFGLPLFNAQQSGFVNSNAVNANAFSGAAGQTSLGGNFGGTQATGTLGGSLNPTQFGGLNGNRGGAGNLANQLNPRNNRPQNQVGGVIVPLTVPISYSAKLMFDAPPVAAPAMAQSVRAMLDRSSALRRPGGIDVFTDGQTVVLRGSVGTVQEKQTAEGMVRLTPGVRQVRNELQVVTP